MKKFEEGRVTRGDDAILSGDDSDGLALPCQTIEDFKLFNEKLEVDASYRQKIVNILSIFQ